MFRSILGRRRGKAIDSPESAPLEATVESLFEALLRYGMASEQHQVDAVRSTYESALAVTSPQDRFQLWPRIVDQIAGGAINPNPLLAMAICDPDAQIAATCALDFVCFSPADEDGRPHGILEFMSIFPRPGVIRNPGAVFGGLLALGDQHLAGFYRETTDFLTADQLQVASHTCRSGRLFHAVIDYWLWLLETLIEDEMPVSQSIVGFAAAAVAALPGSASDEQVVLATRDYPSTQDLQPVVALQVWSLDEYALAIAPRMRAIADREPPPCIMPNVLQAWNIGGN